MKKLLPLLMVSCFALGSCKDVSLGAARVDAGGGSGGGTGGVPGTGGAGATGGTPACPAGQTLCTACGNYYCAAVCPTVNCLSDPDAGSAGGAGRNGGSTSGVTGTGGAGGSASTPGTGGSTGSGGTTGAAGGTTSFSCAAVGCAAPPLCSEGCTAPCGCCPCLAGNRSGDLICTKSGCYTSAVVSDAGGIDQPVDGLSPADAGLDGRVTVDALPGIDSAASSCDNPLPLKCGDRLNHSTLVQGRANVWSGYACSERWMSGPEAIYFLQPPPGCQAAVQLKNPSADLVAFLLPSCSFTSSCSYINPTTDQPSFVVVDGYNGAAGTYTLQVDCTCNQDGGTNDAPPADAPGDTAITPGCDLDLASKTLAAFGLLSVGDPQMSNATLPAGLASGGWDLKATVCRQAGYEIAPLAGKTVCLLSQDITETCQGLPATAWIMMNNGAVACVYKTVRNGFPIAPGVYAVTDANCTPPTIAPGATVLCEQGLSCSNATGPCCPSTTAMNRVGMCWSNCQSPSVTCDGPEDCSNGAVCCSLESAAGGFAGTSCVTPAECMAPSRVVCHQQADCPTSQQCGVPDPMPADVPAPPYPATWRVSFQVCAP